MLRKLILASLLLLPNAAFAQDTAVRYQSQVIGSRGLPLANQSVAVCTQPAVTTTQPCSPLATLATSTATVSGGANPLTTDANGNFFFYAPPGKYTVQVYGPQVGTPFVQADLVLTANPASKYASASAYRYVDGAGSDLNDGLSPGTAFATPQHCNTIVTGLGGGTCDMRTLLTYTSSTEIDCGDTSGHPVICLMPPGNSGGTPSWVSTLTDGVSYGIKVFNNSSVIGMGPGLGAPFQIAAGGAANMGAVCGNDTTVVNAHIRMEGFTCQIYGGSPTVVKAIGYFSGLGDDSLVQNMGFGGISPTATFTKVLWINGSCCKTKFDNVNADGFSNTGVTPCFFGNGITAPNLTITFNGSCVHPGNGASNIVDQEWNQYGSNIFTIYAEAGTYTDTTTPKVSVQAFGSPTAADIFIGMNAAGDVASSTRYMFDIASGAHAIIIGGQQGTVSTNAVNDHNGGGHLVTAPVNSSFSYSTETANYVQGNLVGQQGTVTLKKGTGAGNYTSASTTFVAVDGTNLSLTVTIPIGWKLSVQANGTTTTATAAAQDTVGLNDGACSGATVNLQAVNILPPSANGMEAWSLGSVITGDGASHTVNLCYLTSNAADSATIANSSASVSPTMIFTLTPSN